MVGLRSGDGGSGGGGGVVAEAVRRCIARHILPSIAAVAVAMVVLVVADEMSVTHSM